MEKSIKITLLSASLFALIGVTEATDMSFDSYDNTRETSKLGGNTTKFNNVSENANLADFIDKKFKENIRTKQRMYYAQVESIILFSTMLTCVTTGHMTP